MKFLFIFFFMLAPLNAKEIILNIPDEELAIVENDVESAEQWIQEAWHGKVNSCRERMVKQEVQRSISEGSALPAGEAAIVDKAFARPDYKTRAERQAEIETALQGVK